MLVHYYYASWMILKGQIDKAVSTTTTTTTIFAITVALLFGGGCLKYEAKPLTPAAVGQALALPDEGALRIAAADLRHPALKPVTLDPGRGMSPDEVAVLAVVVNPDLRAVRDRRAAAGAQVIQAGLLPDPQLTAAVDVPYASSPPDNFTAYNVGVGWDVTSLITRDAKRRAAAAAAASVDLDVLWQEWQTAEAAKVAAYNVLAIRAQLDAAVQADRHLADNLAVVRRAVERHERTLVDLPAAEAASRDAHTAVVSLEGDLRRQRLALNRAIGFPPDARIVLRDDGGLPASLTPPAPAALMKDLQSRRLDLLALRRGYESQDQTLRAAILGQFPKINLGFNAARDTSDVRTVGVGVGIDVPLFDRNQGVIATERATRRRLFDEYAARVFAARADIATAVEDIRAANALIADADAAVPALERLVRTYGAAMRQGNADVLSYYNAVAALDQKRIAAIKLRQQLIQNWVALEIAAGRYLPLPAPAAAPTTQESKP
jgi:outer membrane protein TolC